MSTPVEAMRATASALIVHGRIDEAAGADDQDTLVQIDAVADALRTLGCRVETLEVGLDLGRHARDLASLAPDFIFNLVEQIDGSDALLPVNAFLLDRLGIPYTGAPSSSLAATCHKLLAKRLMRAAGIPTPDWIELGERLKPSLRSCSAGLDDRWIVKSVTEHASFGLTAAAVVSSAAIAERGRQSADLHGGEWFAERYVHGREFNLSLLAHGSSPRILPVAEIEFVDFAADAPMIVDYAAKWAPESVAYRNTRRRFVEGDELDLAPRLGRIATDCWDLFGLRGYARVDFRVDSAGDPWVLEVNANPCISPDAGFAAAAARAGIGYADMIECILRDAGISLTSPPRT